MTRRVIKWFFLLVFIAIFILVLQMPQDLEMPVKGATSESYNPESFWYYPWGRSGTHKGVDIFADKGTEITSSTKGIVLYTGVLKYGGNFVFILGPKWRLHYYAHLDSIKTSPLAIVDQQTTIGTVGDSGNAAGKPPHLHYTISTMIPYFSRRDTTPQGWKKIFYLNPIEYLKDTENQ